MFNVQYLRLGGKMPWFVGWVEADKLRAKLKIFVGFRASTQPTKNAWKSRLGLDRYAWRKTWHLGWVSYRYPT